MVRATAPPLRHAVGYPRADVFGLHVGPLDGRRSKRAPGTRRWVIGAEQLLMTERGAESERSGAECARPPALWLVTQRSRFGPAPVPRPC